MALVNCFFCGSQVSDQALICPKCKSERPGDHLHWEKEVEKLEKYMKESESNKKVSIEIVCPECHEIIYNQIHKWKYSELKIPSSCCKCGARVEENDNIKCECGSEASFIFRGKFYCRTVKYSEKTQENLEDFVYILVNLPESINADEMDEIMSRPYIINHKSVANRMFEWRNRIREKHEHRYEFSGGLRSFPKSIIDFVANKKLKEKENLSRDYSVKSLNKEEKNTNIKNDEPIQSKSNKEKEGSLKGYVGKHLEKELPIPNPKKEELVYEKEIERLDKLIESVEDFARNQKFENTIFPIYDSSKNKNHLILFLVLVIVALTGYIIYSNSNPKSSSENKKIFIIPDNYSRDGEKEETKELPAKITVRVVRKSDNSKTVNKDDVPD